MKSAIRILMIAPLVLGLSACIEATAPRLPPAEEEPDSGKDEGSGYIGQTRQMPIG